MNFLAPYALAFAAAIPVVIVFYLLKRKRVVKLISSTVLWQRFLADTQASAPFQKLRHNWLLILQILLLALIVFALARPYFAGDQKSGRRHVLILDGSASMRSTDVKPSRFDSARAAALDLAKGLPDGDEMVVLLSGANTEVKQSATSDKTALRRAIQNCAPSDAPTRLVEALKLAETLIRNQSDPEIHLFSDGALPNLADFENKNLPLRYHKIGERANNAGIVSLEVRANPDDPTQRAIFTRVANFSTNTQRTEIELRFDDEILDVRPLDLDPTNTVPLVLLAPQSRDGVFSLRLTLSDDLAVDNEASVVSLIPKPMKVLLVSRGNSLLERALRAVPGVELSVTPVLTDATPAFDVVVLDNVLPAAWPERNLLAIHVANTNWFPEWDKVEAPLIVDWKNNHPLLRFVSFDTVLVAESIAVPAPNWGLTLVESPRTPLIVAGEVERKRIVWVGFDLLESTWPLRVSFPIFVVNAMEWLNPLATTANYLMVRAGEPFRLSLPPNVDQARIVRPDGEAKTVLPEPNSREIIFGDTGQAGVYRATAGTNEITFCVNLMDAAESDIGPRDELPFGKYARVEATKVHRANLELWRWIAALGLAVLLFEWWFYHKRTA